MRLILVILFGALPPVVGACPPVIIDCSVVGSAAAIFTGVALPDDPTHATVHRYAVQKVYKGLAPGVSVVETVEGERCRIEHTTGETYLVAAYLRFPQARLHSGSCTGTIPLRYAPQEVEYLDQWLSGSKAPS